MSDNGGNGSWIPIAVLGVVSVLAFAFGGFYWYVGEPVLSTLPIIIGVITAGAAIAYAIFSGSGGGGGNEV